MASALAMVKVAAFKQLPSSGRAATTDWAPWRLDRRLVRRSSGRIGVSRWRRH
ncbi:hypothetical protein AB0F59_29760 [Micromonospora lupini]|uniref:hypothetical protein n=1 Tax=Micromonospora lupini TaxID=285679 RepID=UPI003409C9D5